MNGSSKILVSMGLGLFLLPLSAQAQCALSSFTAGGTADWGNYDPFESAAGTPVAMTISIVRSSGAGVCNYSVRARGNTTRQMDNAPYKMNYNYHVSPTISNATRFLDINTTSNAISGSMAAGQTTATHTYYLFIQPQAVSSGGGSLPTGPRPPGIYTSPPTDIIFCDLPAFSTCTTPIATSSVIARANVLSVTELSLQPVGGAFARSATNYNVDFGTLSPASSSQTLQMDVLLRTNVPSGMTATLTAENKGVLKNTDITDSTTIPYTFGINPPTTIRNLSGGPVTFLNRTGTTGFSGLIYRSSIRLGTVPANLAAGTYRDVVTVNVTAN